MTKYVANPLEVDAVQFMNERLKDLPEWVQNYRAYSAMGGSSPCADMPVGNLLVPGLEKSKEAKTGDWLVFDGKVLRVLSNAEFTANFSPKVPDAVPVVDEAPVA